jgi:23S rRNA (cytidine1920-2'-O)/16S rRNA (cytidine1409-2'-O)-methyltransferase
MSPKQIKHRLDNLMVARGLVPTRQKAKALIMAGKVLVDGMRIDKPGRQFVMDSEVTVKQGLPFVSRGGLKLSGALDAFGVDPTGLSILDAGASTGGFTDCLLQRGALRVVAVDVGYGQIHWNLRLDPRVTVMERLNIRTLNSNQLPYLIHAAVADLSFISLKLVLPTLRELLARNGWLIPLIKPQFEVGRFKVGKGGVVRDETKIRQAVADIGQFADSIGFSVLGEVESPIKGPKGNREFFLNLRKK